jgi:hypothetical protein
VKIQLDPNPKPGRYFVPVAANDGATTELVVEAVLEP